jgi:hypothetical protein
MVAKSAAASGPTRLRVLGFFERTLRGKADVLEKNPSCSRAGDFHLFVFGSIVRVKRS